MDIDAMKCLFMKRNQTDLWTFLQKRRCTRIFYFSNYCKKVLILTIIVTYRIKRMACARISIVIERHSFFLISNNLSFVCTLLSIIDLSDSLKWHTQLQGWKRRQIFMSFVHVFFKYRKTNLNSLTLNL